MLGRIVQLLIVLLTQHSANTKEIFKMVFPRRLAAHLEAETQEETPIVAIHRTIS